MRAMAAALPLVGRPESGRAQKIDRLETMLGGGLKVVLLGDSSTGKTTLLTQWCESLVVPNQPPTIGAGFRHMTVDIDGDSVEIDFWDTAGQEMYRSTAPIYCRDAQAAMIVYDITNRGSFAALEQWIGVLTQIVEVPYVLVGNKIDLEEQRKVTSEEGSQFASAKGAHFFETSAKFGIYVEEAFIALAALALESNRKQITNSESLDLVGRKTPSTCC
jgi:small GTP-binding protein